MREIVYLDFFPQALAMGIREEVFWNLNPRKLKPYQEAERIRIKNMNYEAWLHGFYDYQGISVAIGNAFKKKGAKAFEYFKEPIEILPPTPEEQKQRAEIERQKAIAFFTNLGKSFNGKEKAPVNPGERSHSTA